MKRVSVVAGPLAAGLCLLGLALAAEIKSGLQPGEVPDAFNVRNITGQNCKGITQDLRGVLCYR
jgi:hypothetical protein